MNLLVLNYSMDPKSLVFSHQREVVRRLALHFERTFVVTADDNLEKDTNDLLIRSSHWKRSKPLRNAISFYRTVLPLIFSNRNNLVIFSHMTEVQSCLISPFCRFLGVPHYLWYAHKSKSKYLKLSFPFLTGVITSTPGSCPISGPKVHPIGQAIDQELFGTVRSVPQNPPLRWYHVGRMDKSKNIDLIIEVFAELRRVGWNLTLDFYGSSSSKSTQDYLLALTQTFFVDRNSHWLKFHGAIQRDRIPEIAGLYDGFVHAFQGSLDKAVLEATMSKRLVVSINPEFKIEFGYPNSIHGTLFDVLYSQLLAALRMSEKEQKQKIESCYKLTINNHSLDNWIHKLVKVISY
jgi:glycosyltransferase involved in cell wall biosynthesis